MVAEVLYFYAGAVDKHRGATVPVAGGVDMTFHEPLGVVGAIVPWNFPIAITSWKVGPALATGNTIVVKPAEITPLTAVRLAELGLEAGLPEGVLQVVTGKGSVVGHAPGRAPGRGQGGLHRIDRGRARGDGPGVRDHQAGDSGAGRQVGLGRLRRRRPGQGCGIGSRRACSPTAARTAAPAAGSWSSGRSSTSSSTCWPTAVQAWTVGDPTDPATKMGPLVTAAHRGVVAGFLEEGMGAPGGPVPAHTAGAVPDGPGFWFPPTVVAPADPAWRMAREEIFGPIVAVIPFDDEDEAVRLANDTPYGLSGSIWTRDGARSLRMARAVQAGNLSVNSNSSVRVQTSFGGMKQSGFGRELGLEALASYSEVKNVFVSTVD